MFYKIFVIDKNPKLAPELNTLRHGQGLKIKSLHKGKSYLFDIEKVKDFEQFKSLCKTVLIDEGFEILIDEDNPHQDFKTSIDITFKAGVQDNRAHSTLDAFRILVPDLEIKVATGDLYFSNEELSAKTIENLCSNFLMNPLLQTYNSSSDLASLIKSARFPHVVLDKRKAQLIESIDDLENLKKLNISQCWALNTEELKAIQNHFLDPKTQESRLNRGLSLLPTDVEIEILAQTWSEHCKHKIFAAEIDYTETDNSQGKKLGNFKVDGLFKSFIRRSTVELMESDVDFCISVFSDNAGVVRFDPKIDLCIKVETHNSPSALDPYGGALTGILGVNRDILGTGLGAKPLCNMDVFCVGHEEILQTTPLPQNILHPKRLLDGVHKGVEDGGNKSGIPTVNGSILFHDHFCGKPLIFVGTVGVMPQTLSENRPSSVKNQSPGDLIVMSGGRVGADGIHGATFSSLELDENSPATAVQIGDPFTQKKLSDFLIAARDLNLFSSVTDNGAGGLSSSVGEMAEASGGAKLDLSKVPLKYPNLAPFEIMISESQERITFAVTPAKINDFLELSKKYNVESTVIGEFTDHGRLDVSFEGEVCASLDLHFLHEGLPQLKLQAEFDRIKFLESKSLWHGKNRRKLLPKDATEVFLTMLAKPNIASKQSYVKQYDHEVKGSTYTKPFGGVTQSGPNNAGVMSLEKFGGSENSFVVTAHGNMPLLSFYDPYFMAVASIDEAMRNIVSSGGDPRRTALLDNFCWPDPVQSEKTPDGKQKLAGLVRANHALYHYTKTLKTPLVSGKDSMKNDFRGKMPDNSEVKISVPPTLLISALSYIEDEKFIIQGHFQSPGDVIYLIGPRNKTSLGYSEFTRTFETDFDFNEYENIDFAELKNVHHTLAHFIRKYGVQSCHDISDGGVFCALAESSFGNLLGAETQIDLNDYTYYNEGLAQYLVSIDPKLCEAFEATFKAIGFEQIGVVTDQNDLCFKHTKVPLLKAHQSWLGSLS